MHCWFLKTLGKLLKKIQNPTKQDAKPVWCVLKYMTVQISVVSVVMSNLVSYCLIDVNADVTSDKTSDMTNDEISNVTSDKIIDVTSDEISDVTSDMSSGLKIDMTIHLTSIVTSDGIGDVTIYVTSSVTSDGISDGIGDVQGLVRPGFNFRDQDYLNPSLNIETETMNLEVSVLRPRLLILWSQCRD